MRGINSREDQEAPAKGPCCKRKSLHLVQPYVCSPMLRLQKNQMVQWKIKDTLPREIHGSFCEELSATRKLKVTITRLVISECESCHENCHSLCLGRQGEAHHSKLQPRKAPTEMLNNSPTVAKTITPMFGGWHRGNLFYLSPKINFLPGWVHLADYSISWIVLPSNERFLRKFLHTCHKLSYIFIFVLPGLHPRSLSPSDSSFF